MNHPGKLVGEEHAMTTPLFREGNPRILLGDHQLLGLLYAEGEKDVRIAVLDDNQSIREMLQHYLQLEGHTVVVYDSPSKLLAQLMEPTTVSTTFDLLIVDLILSEGMSAGEVIQHVRKSFPDLPVLLVSAESTWEIEAARRAMPTVRVLRTPFRMATLLALLQELKHE